MNREENIRKILENAPDAIVIINLKREIIFVNTRTELLFNYKREELLGQSMEILIPQVYYDAYIKFHNDFFVDLGTRQKVHPYIKLLAKRKGGGEFNAEINLNPLQTDQEETVIIASIRDITDRIRMEDELKQTQEIFHRIFEYSLNGIVKYQPIKNEVGEIIDFKYIVWNRRALELTNRTDDDLKTKTLLELNPWVKGAEIFRIMLHVIEKGDTEIHEFVSEKKGMPVWYKASFIQMDDGLILNFDDISIRKLAEEKLKESNFELEKKVEERTHELLSSNEKLKSINEKLDRYAYMISHDLKAPLANIEAIASFIQQDYEDKPIDQEGKEMLGMMTAKINDMRGIIENVLQSAKDIIRSRETINLVEVVQEVIETLNPPSHFHFFIQHNLPHIKYPRASIVQILQNLLSNAIKYMDKPNPLITISYTEHENYYIICLTDNGMGIPQEKKKEIFEFLSVAHSGRCEIESYGIGLTIVKQLVEENGGKIWVESILGEETKFHFTVPKK